MMDVLTQLMGGFATAGTPINLLWAFAGCALGTAIGVLPGCCRSPARSNPRPR